MLDPGMFSDHGMFMFFYALMEVATSVPNIICIAQITCEFVYNETSIKRTLDQADTRGSEINVLYFPL